MDNQILQFILSIPVVFIASTVHEFAHAWSAYKLGDHTAKIEGRMTLNPLSHIDPIGGILMVLAHFGWSKPVPINENNFKNPVVGTAITALAGSASNFFMAVLGGLGLRALIYAPHLNEEDPIVIFVLIFLQVFTIINLSLGIFNLIPLPPLDGHKVVRALLPKKLRYYWESLEKYGTWILIFIFLPFSPLSQIVDIILNAIMGLFVKIVIY